MPESRQQRRARERREQFDRIHGKVLAGRTVLDLWRVYARERLTPHGIDITDPAVDGTMRQAFYAGAASMLELMTRVSPEDVSEDQGVEMLQRLHEELATYAEKRP